MIQNSPALFNSSSKFEKQKNKHRIADKYEMKEAAKQAEETEAAKAAEVNTIS